MSCAHVKVIAEVFAMIRDGRMPASYAALLIIPVLCAGVVQFFVLEKSKKRFVHFIPLVMVAFTSAASELIYAGAIPMGDAGLIIGVIYAGAALLCYVGLAVGTALWLAVKKSRKKTP
jgi:hypothetical protein